MEDDSFVECLKLENNGFGLVGIFFLDERFLVLKLENRLRISSACTINFSFLNVYWWYDIIFSKIHDHPWISLVFIFSVFGGKGISSERSRCDLLYVSFRISLLLVTCAFSRLVSIFSIYLSWILFMTVSLGKKKKKKLETTFRHPAFHFTIIIIWCWRKNALELAFTNLEIYVFIYTESLIRV